MDHGYGRNRDVKESIVKRTPSIALFVQALACALLVAAPSMAQVENKVAVAPKGAAPASQLAKSIETKIPAKGGVAARKATPGANSKVASLSGQATPFPAPGAGAPVARLENVDGNVLVSTETGLVAGESGVLLADGARLITTTKSNVVIKYFDGCDVTLTSYQRIEIDSTLTCAERAGLVQSLLLTESALLAALEGTSQSIALAFVGLPTSVSTATGLVGASAILGGRQDETVSPN